jgi:hypothetical protein
VPQPAFTIRTEINPRLRGVREVRLAFHPKEPAGNRVHARSREERPTADCEKHYDGARGAVFGGRHKPRNGRAFGDGGRELSA